MLQGLMIRQIFVLVEWILVVLIIAGASFTSLAKFMPHKDAGASLAQPMSADLQNEGHGLVAIKERATYDSIVTANLFGGAGKETGVKEPEPEVTLEVPLEQTALHLKLCGTAATSPKDMFASAIIMDQDKNTVRSFGIGDEVVDSVTLEEVYQRRVVLFNKNANRREELRSDDNPPDKKAETAAPSVPQQAGAQNRMSIKKSELVQDLMSNYADIVTQIKPEMYRDKDGKVAGITAANLETLPIAKKLDIRNGDVLQSVNNETIDSEAKVVELINKYRNANMVRVNILRDGKPVTVTYRLTD